jgi:hypothetical protein
VIVKKLIWKRRLFILNARTKYLELKMRECSPPTPILISKVETYPPPVKGSGFF